MNRKQLEREIVKKLKEIKKLYYEAYPEGDYLALCFFRNTLSFNNKYFYEDKEYPIRYYKFVRYRRCKR